MQSNELYPIFALISSLGLLILAVACSNLGSLLLARGVAREREISIRVAVGAGRARLMRQLFTESLMLAFGGAMVGIVLGYFVLQSLMALTGVPAWLTPTPDGWVTLFALGMGFVTAILFGLTPAWQIARQRHRTTVVRQILVGAQVAASCILLILAGLLSRALNYAMSAHPGFEYQQVVAINPQLSTHGYSPAQARTYLDTLQSRFRALPGIESASLALIAPLGNGSIGAGINIDGRSVDIQINHVDSEFFRTMHIPLLRGRNLTPDDKRAVIISESLARLAWPGQSALGKKFTLGDDYMVVGIAGSARLIKLEDSGAVEVYFPIETVDLPLMNVLVKTSASPEELARIAAITAKAVNPQILPEIQLLKSGFRRKLQNAEYSALAVSVLGSLAHLLACLGIVGVIAYAVSQRTKEIGIRMALGAPPMQILLVVLRQFLWPVTLGLLVGVAAAVGLSQLLRGALYGISNLDLVTYLAAIGLFTGTVILAALLPARRALRINPVHALRQD